MADDQAMKTTNYNYEELKLSMRGGSTPFQQRFGITPENTPKAGGLVYMGTKMTRQGNMEDVFEPIADAKYKYGSFSEDEAKKFYGTLNKYFPNGWDESYVENAWVRALNISADRLRSEGNLVTPFQAFDTMLDQAARNGALGGGSRGGGAGGGGGPTITGQVNLTDPGTAKILVDQALESYLGRKANDREIAAFTGALNKKEMESPKTSEIVGTTAVTSGGFNPSAFAEQYAQGQEGTGEYQAATTFLDTFISSLKAQV